jgi:ElaB/YqjD/DUF883 family membrane-anchored ribosome-binding protein
MKTITKVAIGCGVALLLAVTAAVAVFVGGAFWLKGKVEQVSGTEKRIEEAKRRANEAAAPFSRPVDGTLQEARLVKFLEIRKRMFTIYEQHRLEIEALSKKEKGDLGDVMKAYAWVNDLRKAHADAQAETGVGDEEYAFLVEQVYKSAWAAEILKSTGGKSPSEAVGAAAGQMTEAFKRAQEQLHEVSDERRQQIQEAIEETEAQPHEASEQARSLDVPKANLDLYRKYEDDIKKYAMNGLEWLGM